MASSPESAKTSFHGNVVFVHSLGCMVDGDSFSTKNNMIRNASLCVRNDYISARQTETINIPGDMYKISDYLLTCGTKNAE